MLYSAFALQEGGAKLSVIVEPGDYRSQDGDLNADGHLLEAVL